MKVNIITLGCSKNTVDSENVAGHLRKAGFKVYFDRERNDCDIVIINTCGFIGDAKEESIAAILEQVEVKKNGRKERKLIVVGCLVQRYKEELSNEIPEVDAYYGAHQWDELISSLVEAYSSKLEAERAVSTPKHYAYLKIAEGCNRRCSYCAIPLIRGKHISRPIDELVEEAKWLVKEGARELIVVAQDTTYYGLDLYGERKLGTLLERLALESGAKWIRLHYTYPTSFPQDAIEVIKKYPNICNYIDIPLQHINTDVLGSMQRGIGREGTIDLIARFREALPDVAIRTTMMVGYPNETPEAFEELKEYVKEARFDRLGVFAYSPEEGTPAEGLGDPIPQEEKERRVSEIMAIQEVISLEKNLSRIGKTFDVIIDRVEGDYLVGRTEYDSPEVDDEVLIPYSEKLKEGDFCKVKVVKAYENDLLGEVVK